jgi:hypothetical protein
MQAEPHRFSLLIDADGEGCHARHCFKNRGTVGRRLLAPSLAKWTMVRDQNRRDSSIVDFLRCSDQQ